MFKFVYIVRTDQNPSGSCQPFSILYIIMMTACAAAYRATVVKNAIYDRGVFICTSGGTAINRLHSNTPDHRQNVA